MGEIQNQGKASSGIFPFLIKVCIVAVAILFVITASVSMAIDALGIDSFQGGRAFWKTAEEKLYKLADEPDLPPEKKAKIVNALTKLSIKYKPYIDAISGKPSP
jgi:hypothetical protein